MDIALYETGRQAFLVLWKVRQMRAWRVAEGVSSEIVKNKTCKSVRSCRN